MKRRHLARDVSRFVDEARRLRPDVVFGADMIAGFPTEDEDAHQHSLDLIRDCQISLLHVFGYSPREGTPAAKMPQIDGQLIKSRSRDLRTLGTSILHDMLDRQIGQHDEILIEPGQQGHLRNFTKAKLNATTPLYDKGTIMKVVITGREGDILQVQPATQAEAAEGNHG